MPPATSQPSTPAWQWLSTGPEHLAVRTPSASSPAGQVSPSWAPVGSSWTVAPARPRPAGAHVRTGGRVWLTVVMVVLLAMAGAAGGWFFLNRHHPSSQAATAPRAADVVGRSAIGGWRDSAALTGQNPAGSKLGTSCTLWRIRYDAAPSGATSVIERVTPSHAESRACAG